MGFKRATAVVIWEATNSYFNYGFITFFPINWMQKVMTFKIAIIVSVCTQQSHTKDIEFTKT